MNYIRKATTKDVEKIMEITEAGRSYLVEQGLPQWQDGDGPNRGLIDGHIKAGQGYVFMCEGAVRGYGTLITGVDPVYTAISGGTWEEVYDEYISIHSVALDPSIRGKGLAKDFLHRLVMAAGVLGYYDIRIDTYPRNAIMDKAILNTGFVYRGDIEFDFPNGERRAYQLLLI